MKNEETTWVFMFQKYGNFLSYLGHFIKALTSYSRRVACLLTMFHNKLLIHQSVNSASKIKFYRQFTHTKTRDKNELVITIF